MLNYKSLLMVAVATISITSFAHAENIGYLGSRDDIIINNAGSSASAASDAAQNTAKEKTIEVVKEVKEVTSEAMSDTMNNTMDEVVETKAVVSDTNYTTKKVSMPDERMKTITMKSVSSEQMNRVQEDVAMPALPSGTQGDVPPNARPGECYAKVLIPAITETMTERIQISEEQKVLDRIIPARYETTTERIKVKEARQYWKAGTGPITKKNEVTGEILCLVEEPAEYKTIEKRVLVSPEQPQYKMVPAQYDTITKQNIVKAESWEWRRILCETNLSNQAITEIQRALNSKGYNIKVDGKLGDSTMSAINSYQLKNGLASRGITYETLSHMGVSLAGA